MLGNFGEKKALKSFSKADWLDKKKEYMSLK